MIPNVGEHAIIECGIKMQRIGLQCIQANYVVAQTGFCCMVGLDIPKKNWEKRESKYWKKLRNTALTNKRSNKQMPTYTKTNAIKIQMHR